MTVRLEATRVTATIERLTLRIKDRFPDSELHKVCTQMESIARLTERTSVRIARPVWLLRLVIILLIAVFLIALAAILANYEAGEKITLFGLVQTVDAGASLLILLALGAAYLWSIEARIKRNRAIKAINELRDIAHVIDMKQLVKDPDCVAGLIQPTIHSPQRNLDAYALGRYLDYCTEMLSLTSKLGYLYVEHFHDSEVTKASTELENLCNGLSRKIWQKIIILRAQNRIS